MNHRSCAQRTRLQRDIQRASIESVVAEHFGGFTQRHNLRMCRWIVIPEYAVLSTRDDYAVMDDHCANRHFTGLRGTACLSERSLHRFHFGDHALDATVPSACT